jgi:hypothetical protein
LPTGPVRSSPGFFSGPATGPGNTTYFQSPLHHTSSELLIACVSLSVQLILHIQSISSHSPNQHCYSNTFYIPTSCQFFTRATRKHLLFFCHKFPVSLCRQSHISPPFYSYYPQYNLPAPQSGLPSWQAGLASNSTQNINDSTKLHPINLH